MRQVSIFILAAIIISCNSPGKKQDKTSVREDSILSSEALPAGIEAVKLEEVQLPQTIRYKGKLFEAWKWNDRNGENILIASFTGPEKDKHPNEWGEESVSAHLYAAHYIRQDTGYVILWQITDHEKACGFDLTAEFIKGSIIVTDVDKDETAETWIQYKTACRSDVSPAYMKLVMHEGAQKHTLRGNMWIKASEQDSFTVTEQTANLEKLPKKKDEFDQLMQRYGRYENERDFTKTSPAFLAFARKQWMKFVVESFE